MTPLLAFTLGGVSAVGGWVFAQDKTAEKPAIPAAPATPAAATPAPAPKPDPSGTATGGIADVTAKKAGSEHPQDNDATWWGHAGYAAYEFKNKLRAAVRGEFLQRSRKARGPLPAARGPVGDHGHAAVQGAEGSRRASRVSSRPGEQADLQTQVPGLVPTGKTQDTISLDLYHTFF